MYPSEPHVTLDHKGHDIRRLRLDLPGGSCIVHRVDPETKAYINDFLR